MGRAQRLHPAGSVVHLTARGVRKTPIFLDDHDRRMFMAFLVQSIHRQHWVCLGYCLMTNHYHVVLELRDANLSEGMHRLNWLYALRFNERYDHVGHLFEARYGSRAIETKVHLVTALTYVALNPVRAGLCDDPADWQWSSFRATAGIDRSPSFLSVSRVRQLFGRGAAGAERYAEHVRALAALSSAV